MGEPGDIDYPFWKTLDETLVEAKEQIDLGRNAPSMESLGWRLKMAIMALKCASQIYGDRIVEMKNEKGE